MCLAETGGKNAIGCFLLLVTSLETRLNSGHPASDAVYAAGLVGLDANRYGVTRSAESLAMSDFDQDASFPSSLNLMEAQAKAMFDRVLVSWASDLLELRRLGLASPGWRERVDGVEGPEWRRAA